MFSPGALLSSDPTDRVLTSHVVHMRNAAVAGTNDLLFCWNAVTFETHLEALARALLQLPEGPRVMLVVPPPLARDSSIGSDRVLRLEMKHRVATMVKRLQLDTPARPFSRVLLVDLRPRFEMYCARGSANRTAAASKLAIIMTRRILGSSQMVSTQTVTDHR